MNILDFAESRHLELSPVQKIVLKLFYKLPLDNKIEFKLLELDYDTLKFREEVYTEESYVKMSVALGRIKLSDNPDKLCLIAGRRAGKTLLTSIINAFELHDGQHIPGPLVSSLVLISHTIDSGESLLREIREHVIEAPTLKDRLANDSRREIRLQTDTDISETGTWVGSKRSARASLEVKVVSKHTELRGMNLYLMSLDDFQDERFSRHVQGGELARLLHFGKNCRKTVLSATPLIVGPHTLRDIFESSEDYLRFQAPAWHMNPKMLELKFLDETLSNLGAPRFVQEYGGEFLDLVSLELPKRRLDLLSDSKIAPWRVS